MTRVGGVNVSIFVGFLIDATEVGVGGSCLVVCSTLAVL